MCIARVSTWSTQQVWENNDMQADSRKGYTWFVAEKHLYLRPSLSNPILLGYFFVPEPIDLIWQYPQRIIVHKEHAFKVKLVT